jgi:hypothetical protein
MSSQQRAKRLCTHQPESAPAQAQIPGRDQLLLKSPELQSRLGKRYCDESELLPLLLSHGLVSRVRAIEVAVRPLGGDNFTIRLGAAKPSMGEAKVEISRVQGTEEARQELHKVEVRADGEAVRDSLRPPVLVVLNGCSRPAGRLLRGVWPSTMYNDHAL